jgi:hypothetical protein
VRAERTAKPALISAREDMPKRRSISITRIPPTLFPGLREERNKRSDCQVLLGEVTKCIWLIDEVVDVILEQEEG